MTSDKPLAVTLFHLPAYLRAKLEDRFRIVDLSGLSAAEAAGVRAVVTTGTIGCGRALMESLPRLGIVAINGVGFDKVDLDAARERGVVVANTPGVLTDDVADLAVGLVISLLRDIPKADRFVRGGRWPEAEFALGTKVTGRRFGIVGLGRIGTAIAERLSVFGPVSYTASSAKSVRWTFHEDPVALARACDVLIIACAATERTRSLIGADVLNALGESGYLINVARGSVVDEPALIGALKERRLAGGALDVFESEPNVAAELASCDHVVLTPHIGSATVETRRAMADALVANLDAFIAGAPVPHVVR